MADKDDRFGQPLVCSGISPSEIHHAGVAAHINGIDPDIGLQRITAACAT
jgi:hypothetical protein